MPRHVARMLACDATVDTPALETARDFLREKTVLSARRGDPADFTTHRNIRILSLTIDMRAREE